MNKECKLVTMLKNGRIIKESILFQDLEKELHSALCRGEKLLEEDIKKVDSIGEKYGDLDYGFEQKNEISSMWNLRRQEIMNKFKEQKRLYNKVCSISLKDDYLHLFISRLFPYNLSVKEKQQLLQKEGTTSEIIEIAGKKHLFYKVRIRIPQKFQKKDPEKNTEFTTWILNNLRCNALTAMIIANEWKSSAEFEVVK